MPDHKPIAITGRIVDVFAHRFTLKAEDGRMWLADLGPKGAEAFALKAGLVVIMDGEQKPSEIKVLKIAREGEQPVSIPHKPKHGPGHHGPHHHGPGHHEPHHSPAQPKVALKAVERAGLDPVGTPRRKPKHFEVLARRGNHFVECHVELDGHIRKEKPVAPDDHKWSDELAAA